MSKILPTLFLSSLRNVYCSGKRKSNCPKVNLALRLYTFNLLKNSQPPFKRLILLILRTLFKILKLTKQLPTHQSKLNILKTEFLSLVFKAADFFKVSFFVLILKIKIIDTVSFGGPRLVCFHKRS